MISLLEDIKLVRKLNKLNPELARQILHALTLTLSDAGNEYLSYQVAEMISAKIYPKYKFSEYSRIFLDDEEFLNYYKGIMDQDNWHSLDRKYTLNELLKLCLRLDGDLAECGVYKGASAYLMCKMYSNSSKQIHLFDSFEGLSAPNEKDGDYWKSGSLSSPEELVIETLRECVNYKIYKGWIPERFNEVADKNFCFVHIDVDLYTPTLESLKFFYDRLVKNGIILLDDYGFKSCPGAKEAADNFFKDKEPIIKLTTGQAFIVKE